MASIFKNNLIKERLAGFEVPDLEEKISLIKEWRDDYHDGTLKSDKETSREQAYNRDIFQKVLGYEEKPKTPFTFEPKSTTDAGQLPDAITGYFDGNDNKEVSAVVELKGADIDLDRPQQRAGNMSPVQQAFKYKIQYSNCPFVIVSNFYEFRLYQDNQLDYEVWTLDDLVDEKDNYFQFRKFYYLLCENNFVAKSGKSNTQELLTDIRVEQEEISNDFYNQYAGLRLKLLRNLYLKNKTVRDDIKFGISKAQKIIDRIVFVCFCEDRGLLPENTLPRVLKQSSESYGSLWNSLKGFLDAIDGGSEKLNIPEGYNGGLFKTDADLNNLEIDDDAIKGLTQLSRYNFNEDLGVTILGQIFEQSISDLEKIKEKAEEKDDADIEDVGNVGKRKKDGIFYTPDYIVDYIVNNSLGTYLREKEEELKSEHNLKEDILDKNYKKREQKVYEKYQSFLENIKILDPACGSGAFLVKVFDYLLAEHKRVGSILQGKLLDDEEVYKSILQNNIFGVDLNEESVQITKLSLWLKTARKNEQLTSLDKNIKCGNSLIDDPEVAGNKAFDWSKEFSKIMDGGGFDVIVGNPPYIRPHHLSKSDKEFFWKEYTTFEAKSDIYAVFTEFSLNLLKDGGELGFIMPHTWMYLESFEKLRNMILENFRLHELTKPHKKVFSGAQVNTVILNIKKSTPEYTNVSRIDKEGVVTYVGEKKQIEWLNQKTINLSLEYDQIFKKIDSNSDKTGDFLDIHYGFKTADDDKFLTKNPENTSEYKKVLRRSDFGRYYTDFKGEYVHYRPDLMRENKKTARPGTKERFETKKMVVMDIATEIIATIDNENFYVKDALIFLKKDSCKTPLEYFLGLMNSKILNFYYKNKFEVISVAKNAMVELPVKIAEKSEVGSVVDKVTEVLKLESEIQSISHSFNSVINEYLKKEKKLLIENIDEKSLLKKISENTNLKKKDEIVDLFNSKKADVLPLMVSRNDLIDEIDKDFYKIYNLNAEEVGLIKK